MSVYDEFPDRYDQWYEEHPAAFESEVQAINALLPSFERGLEIGVGTGRFATTLGLQEGVDPSRPMLARAKQRGLHVQQGTAEALPYPDDAFDLVLMTTTLCFLSDPEQAWREAYRVLESEGYFITGFIDRSSPLGKKYLARKSSSVFYTNARFHSAAEVRRLFENTGFTELRVRQTLFADPDQMTRLDPTRDGHGEGSFVVMRGQKPAA